MNPWSRDSGERSLAMQGAYTIGGMKPEQVDAAYLLVEAAGRPPDIESWRAYCDTPGGAAGARRDLRVATNPRGHVKGLCLCQQARHAVHGAILDVPVFVVASAADEPGVASAMVDDLCALAGRLDCAAVRIRTGASARSFSRLEAPRRVGGGVALILDPSPMIEPAWPVAQGVALPVKT
jgi:hypothetical protein